MPLDEFFSKAGAMTSSSVQASGTYPMRTFVAKFTYERGSATYDGRNWLLKLF